MGKIDLKEYLERLEEPEDREAVANRDYQRELFLEYVVRDSNFPKRRAELLRDFKAGQELTGPKGLRRKLGAIDLEYFGRAYLAHYNGSLDEVFSGFVAKEYDGGAYINEVNLKDEMLLLEETIINDTFLNTTPQEMISFFLSKAGLSKMKLASKGYPKRKMLPIREQSVVQAINTVNAAWGLKVPFFFSGGTFYWDEKPEQSKVYTFEHGVNIINLTRAGGVWELETVSAPFVKHSHKINLIHPQISGEQEVLKVVSTTNDSGFIRTYIYF